MIELRLSDRKFFDLGKTEEERALTLHEKAVIVDGLTCLNPKLMPSDYEWFRRMKDSGVTASNVTTVGRSGELATPDFRSAVEIIFKCIDLLEKSCLISDSFATTTEHILKAKEENTHALILGFQHPEPVENDVYLLSILHRLGTRVMQLTYNERNLIGDGCNERTDCGLSDFGLQVVEEMNRLGMLIDLSHVGHTTTMEAIEHSKDPASFTHVGMWSLCENVRNKTDKEIKALSEKNGVVGIVAWSPLTHLKKGVRPTMDDFMTHIDYAVDLVGADHVGFGLDLSYGEITTVEEWERYRTKYPAVCGPWTAYTRKVEGLENISGLINITKGLVARGYSDQEIKKILGGNFIKLFKKVWGK
jgi:membrane dipeptidase